MRSIKSIATVLLCALLVGGCGTTVNTRTTTVSVGQQLIDLQNAYKSGSMTQDQYKKAKEQLIERVLD
jgi:PBP1b-binding outer membrane lipoprotein LpoB